MRDLAGSNLEPSASEEDALYARLAMLRQLRLMISIYFLSGIPFLSERSKHRVEAADTNSCDGEGGVGSLGAGAMGGLGWGSSGLATNSIL